VITVQGVCAPQPKTTAAKGAATGAAAKPATAAKTPPADCKTVITKAEFEKLLKGIPNANANAQMKRNIANMLPKFIAWSDAASKQGLDKTPQFAEMMKFAKMQILTGQLQQKIQEDAAKIPDEQIADYYQKNPEAFEQYSLERLFVPRTKQVEPEIKDEEQKEEKLTDEQQKAKQAEDKAKQDAAEQEMTKLAESLRARAAAGEEIAKLQKEAFDAAGMKIESPTVSLPSVRRTGLPPSQAAAFELKPGDVSQVISDSGGHYVYKLKSKEELPLEQVKEEIHRTLQGQRTRDMMDKVNNSFHADTNEAYFGPAGPGGNMPPPQRMPNPRMAPSPTAPQAQPKTPPASPPAAPPPAAKPN
jgi:parvulin-like peptidyl-prolyl cis-trans isomerase-like protein